MRVHHVIGGRMRPPGAPEAICHVLICEHEAGLVLIDSGLGTADLADPCRLGPMARLLRPDTDPSTTALAAVLALGHGAQDVTHVVLTHLDFDHAGGLSDFPHAVVHTTAAEWVAAGSTAMLDRMRYRPVQWRTSGAVRRYEGPGSPWAHGLSGHAVLPGITLVPMAGHTRGHAAVAVEGADGAVVHAGDAFFDAGSVHADLSAVPALRAFELAAARQPLRVRRHHRALRRLAASGEVRVVNAHDARLLPEPTGSAD